MVAPGLRSRGGCRLPRRGRRIREGERQQSRPHPRSVRTADAEDRRGADHRRRPGCDEPRHRLQHGYPAECLERQAGGPDRRGGNPEVAIPPHGASRLSVLQQRHQEAQRLLCAVQDVGAAVPHLELAGREAGYKLADAPKTWDAFWDFFKPMQKKLRDKGMRGVYALGLQPTTTGPADGNNMFHYFLIAHGGNGIVTPDGKPHLDDPQVKEAVIKALTYVTTAFKEGYVPPGALSWNDADDNNAFHAKQMIAYIDGTISPEVALYHKKEEYDDIVTMGLPLDNAGKQIPSQLGVGGAFVAKGAKNVE